MACWVARAVLCLSPHVVFACRACGLCASPRVGRALSHVCRAPGSRVTRFSRVGHVYRVASARDNKLFSLINTYVNNLSGRVFSIVNLRFARLIIVRLIF
jgi:hypothetical protein